MHRKSGRQSILALTLSNLLSAIQRCAWETLRAAMMALIRPDIVTRTQPAGILPPNGNAALQSLYQIPHSSCAGCLAYLNDQQPCFAVRRTQRRQRVSWPAGSRICFSRSASASACTVMPCRGNQETSLPACPATQRSIGTPCHCGAPADFVSLLCQLCVSQRQTTCLTQTKEITDSCLTEVRGWNWRRSRPSSRPVSRLTSGRWTPAPW